MSDFAGIDREAFRQGVEDALTFAPLRRFLSQLSSSSYASSPSKVDTGSKAITPLDKNGLGSRNS